MFVVPVDKGGWVVLGSRYWDAFQLDFDQAVRWEWGEACWTARILSDGEVAQRYLIAGARTY